jgi:hypothetical protein
MLRIVPAARDLLDRLLIVVVQLFSPRRDPDRSRLFAVAQPDPVVPAQDQVGSFWKARAISSTTSAASSPVARLIPG